MRTKPGQREQVIICVELILAIAGFLVAVPFGNWFHRPGITFAYEGTFPMSALDMLFRKYLPDDAIKSVPNVMQSFRFQNLTNNKDVEDLKYIFTAPGPVCHYILLSGTNRIGTSEWTELRNPHSVSLSVDRLPPGVPVTGLICYRVADPATASNMSKPEAAASGISPDRLNLSPNTSAESTLFGWIVTVGLIVLSLGLLTLSMWSMRRAIRESRTDAVGYSIIKSWPHVQRDGRDFARSGAGVMYWFRVPLGGICYPGGFHNFLEPALDNGHVSIIRFILDANTSETADTWSTKVLPLIEDWATRKKKNFEYRGDNLDTCGQLVIGDPASPDKKIDWLFEDLSREFSPCFKIFTPDPHRETVTQLAAQVFVATEPIKVEQKDGTHTELRLPNATVRIETDVELLRLLERVVSRWNQMFI